MKHVMFVIRDPSQTVTAKLVELQQQFRQRVEGGGV